MNVYLCRYPFSCLIGDYLGGTIGLAVMVLPLVTLKMSLWLVVPMSLIALLFLVFLAVTLDRHWSTIRVDDTLISVRNKTIPWSMVSSVRLDYFSTRHDHQKGWSQLKLKGNGQTIRLDSRLTHFHDIVERAVTEARKQKITLDEVTSDNLVALGLMAPETQSASSLSKGCG